ncbi:MAG: MBL fold metallo-hydrolase [Deltaproteobacteria bacterium]|nr:MBL fold metallo-hydrolase [Deltaproteobacteria bacterium]
MPTASLDKVKQWARRTAIAAAAVVVVGSVALVWLWRDRPSLDAIDWAPYPSVDASPGAVRVTWLGVATLLFDDGETQLLIDGFISRPTLADVVLGKPVESDAARINYVMDKYGMRRLAAIIPAHSHYDHAMDAPEVARRTGALLLGSESTANIGRGWGLPEKQIRVVADREPIALGKFTVTPIESRHFQFPDPEMAARALGDPEIGAPLTPPVGAFDYRLGKAYALHVAHPKGTWLILGSAGFVERALEPYASDVVFLGIGALGSQTDAYRQTYWKESVERTNPARVVLIHWDSLTGPIDGPFTGMVRAAALLSKGSDNLLPFLQAKRAANPDIELMTLPRYAPVQLF